MWIIYFFALIGALFSLSILIFLLIYSFEEYPDFEEDVDENVAEYGVEQTRVINYQNGVQVNDKFYTSIN